MAEAVCEYQGTALFCKVYSCIIAFFIFRNVFLDDDLVIFQAEGFFHFFNTVYMSCGITFVFITDTNQTDFKSRCFCLWLASCYTKHTGRKDCSCRKACYVFFHDFLLSISLKTKELRIILTTPNSMRNSFVT